jgi:hypothetical protein
MGSSRQFSQSALVEARIQYRLALGNRMIPLPFETTEFPVVSDDWSAQVHYWLMRIGGESHNMAEMLATRSFPALKTDAIFQIGRCNGNQFEKQPWLGNYYRKKAAQAGVNTTGKYYSRALADFPGDPTAWVSDRHDVLRVCQQKGFKCSGLVDYTPPEIEAPVPDVKLADDLLEEEIARRIELNPDLSREDVFDEAYNSRAGNVSTAPAWEPEGPDLSEVARDDD